MTTETSIYDYLINLLIQLTIENNGEDKDNNRHKLILKLIAEKDESTIDELLNDWLSWPPDVFAVTSLFLKQTGAYIFTVVPPSDQDAWPDAYDWKGELARERQEWFKWLLNQDDSMPQFLADIKDTLLGKVENSGALQKTKAGWEKVTLEAITHFSSSAAGEDRDNVWEICKAFLHLHALADETCQGFGIPAGNHWLNSQETDKSEDLSFSDEEVQTLLQCIANILLAQTGSLSRLPKQIARVLPKLRSPDVGLTLRNFSHNLSLHQTEVDVNWRTMPWVNIDEDTLNILIVPWPEEIESSWFHPSSYSPNRNSPEITRYFEYKPDCQDFSSDELMYMIKDAERSVQRVHIVVFPELALTEENLRRILSILSSNLPRDKMPMVLTGVRTPAKNGELGRNRVVLSTFYAGKWYQLEQDKHHRWKIDSRQIHQYNLGGALAGSRKWWEAIEIRNRRLSILAPSEWLVLCPLICEDLARLEPVSEIIRGIGPTLLIALLLDGPQLQERWPGRYASVLADDPGTSVLTVTSLGLSQRSIPVNNEPRKKTIGLWKDNIKGWKSIDLEENKKGVVLTISAEWKEEFTSDGRSDDGSGAVFVWQGIHQIEGNGLEMPPKEYFCEDISVSNEDDFREITLLSYFFDAALDFPRITPLLGKWVLGTQGAERLENSNPKYSLWEQVKAGKSLPKWLTERQDADLKISLWSLIKQQEKEIKKQNKVLEKPVRQWALGVLDAEKLELNLRPCESLWRRIDDKNSLITDDFGPYISWFCDLIRALNSPVDKTSEQSKDESQKRIARYKRIVERTRDILKHVIEPGFLENLQQGKPFEGLKQKLDWEDFPDIIRYPSVPLERQVRVYIYDCLALLWAIHARLNQLRFKGELNRDGAKLLADIEEILSEKYDRQWTQLKLKPFNDQEM